MDNPWPSWLVDSFVFVNQPQYATDENMPASFVLNSQCMQADNQMRNRFRDLRHNLVMPRLPGISAFGTQLAFYKYTAATNTITPPTIPTVPIHLINVAPAEQWKYDLLEPDDIAQMCRVIEDVKAMCQDRDK